MTAPPRCNPFMKSVSIALLICLASLSAVTAAPPPTPVSPIFINSDPMIPPTVPPQVDAIIFKNESLFVSSNDFLFAPIFPTPYSAQSVRFWTNNGVMVGLPGFRFDNTPNPAHLTQRERLKRGANLPKPSEVFYNDGEIVVSESLKIHARNVINPGLISGDTRSRINILATNGLADLSRGAIQTGDLPIPTCVSPNNFFFGPFFFGQFFFSPLFFGLDPAVSYQYFSSGISGSLGTNRFPLQLPSLNSTGSFFGASFVPPNPNPPSSEYRQSRAIFPGFPTTNVVTNVLTSLQNCGLYDAYLHITTNLFGRDISVVFVPTNGLSTNVSVQVRFPTNSFFSPTPIVEFGAAEFDVIQQANVTNYVTFRDDGGSIFRGRDCDFLVSDLPNAPLTTDLYYNDNFRTNTAQYNYTVASALVGTTNSVYYTNAADTSFFIFPQLGQTPNVSNPSNYPGSIFINARDLDLSQARLRAENGIYIKTGNLLGSDLSFLDAPFITLDAAARDGSLVMSNLARPLVSRVQASLNSWAGSWTAQVTNPAVIIGTNALIENWNYHVLIVGACVDALHPAIFHKLTLRSTNIVIEDMVAVNNSFTLEGRSVTFGPNSSLMLPRASNLAYTNLQGVTSFTNDGFLNLPGGAFFGAFQNGFVQPPPRRGKKPQGPRLETYTNFVNHNTIVASSVSARSAYLEDAGTASAPARITATNGTVKLDGALTLIRQAVVTASSDIQITAGSLLISDSVFTAGSTGGGRFSNSYLPGTLILTPTNAFTDGGVGANNLWNVTSGLRLTRRPQNPGNLLGTHIVSRAGTVAQAVHVWAGQDRGTNVAGYSNNLAVGRLTLDGSLGNLFRFQSAQGTNAIYVDYLELLNSATNYNFAIGVAPSFTIYFADSNISPEKLEENGGGRLRWVSQYAGPGSSTNITYPNGVTYTFNRALVRSNDADSDGDGIPNASDCTPIIPPGQEQNTGLWFGALCPAPLAGARILSAAGAELGLTITLAAEGREAVLQWKAAAGSSSTLEFTDSLTGGTWQTLTNFTHGPANVRVTVRDAVGAPLRVYRVRVDAGKP